MTSPFRNWHEYGLTDEPEPKPKPIWLWMPRGYVTQTVTTSGEVIVLDVKWSRDDE